MPINRVPLDINLVAEVLREAFAEGYRAGVKAARMVDDFPPPMTHAERLMQQARIQADWRRAAE